MEGKLFEYREGIFGELQDQIEYKGNVTELAEAVEKYFNKEENQDNDAIMKKLFEMYPDVLYKRLCRSYGKGRFCAAIVNCALEADFLEIVKERLRQIDEKELSQLLTKEELEDLKSEIS